jgi:hypothetical protein
VPTPATQRNTAGVAAAARAGEWWEHKLAPVAATGYATAWLVHAPLGRTTSAIAVTVGAVAICATYVSILNDLTDLESDARAGKPNRLAGRSRPGAVAVLTGCVAVGAAIAAVNWRDDPLALAAYAASWIAFTAYSVPPLRLKARGFAGALADATGAELGPRLLAAAAVLAAAGAPADVAWLACVFVWALSSGLRGAIWHQRRDAAADARAGIATFARTRPRAVSGPAITGLFAVEVAALGALLIIAGDLLAIAALAAYAMLVLLRARLLGVQPVLTGKRRRTALCSTSSTPCCCPSAC